MWASFYATHGQCVTHDDMFNALEVPAREAEIKHMEGDKVSRLEMSKLKDNVENHVYFIQIVIGLKNVERRKNVTMLCTSDLLCAVQAKLT